MNMLTIKPAQKPSLVVFLLALVALVMIIAAAADVLEREDRINRVASNYTTGACERHRTESEALTEKLSDITNYSYRTFGVTKTHEEYIERDEAKLDELSQLIKACNVIDSKFTQSGISDAYIAGFVDGLFDTVTLNLISEEEVVDVAERAQQRYSELQRNARLLGLLSGMALLILALLQVIVRHIHAPLSLVKRINQKIRSTQLKLIKKLISPLNVKYEVLEKQWWHRLATVAIWVVTIATHIFAPLTFIILWVIYCKIILFVVYGKK